MVVENWRRITSPRFIYTAGKVRMFVRVYLCEAFVQQACITAAKPSAHISQQLCTTRTSGSLQRQMVQKSSPSSQYLRNSARLSSYIFFSFLFEASVEDLAIAIPNQGKNKMLFNFNQLAVNGISWEACQIAKSGYKLKVALAYQPIQGRMTG